VNTQKLPVMDVTLLKQAAISSQSVGPSFEKKSIVSYSDFNSNTQVVESNPDGSYDMAQSGDSDFPNWFERPVRITDITWAVNASIATTFKPWNLWAKEARIANRLNNYRNFRGKLHVKFLINGNQFYWGRLLCSYNPYDIMSAADSYVNSTSLVQCSQRPHLYLDPSSSTGGEMVLPFFHPENAIDLTQADSLNEMGTMEINGLSLLRKMNGTQAVSISVWAWCEDVVLSGPTQISMDGLTAQAEIDEYGEGPVSKPASAIANFAGKLAKAPVIGPYARATQMGAGVLGNIATMFGYSRPTIISEPCVNSPLPVGNLAQVDAPDTSRSMALTSKQEVTVDPRTVGLGSTDEMDLNSVCAHESYFTSFLWDYSDATGDLLFNMGVAPMMSRSLAADQFDLPAVSFAALPFRYWCGSMTYRFQIVASGYHKGRIMICWDPIRAATTGQLLSHTKYTHIIDIAEERDFEITVGWGSPKPALIVPAIDDTNHDTNVLVFDGNKYNGALAVYVLNDLVTSQDTTDPISILVSIKSNDMNLFAPHEQSLEDLSYHRPPGVALANIQAQADIEQSDANMPDGDAIQPEGENIVTELGPTGFSDKQISFCEGEKITSFRQCVKRYSQHTVHGAYGQSAGATSALNFYIHKQPAMPYQYGYEPQGVDRDALDVPFNDCTLTMLNYLSPAYAGWRGSIRWKLTPVQAPCCSWMMEARRCGSSCTYEDNFTVVDVPTASPDPLDFTRAMRAYLQADLRGGWDGTVVTATQHNPTLEFSIPYYNNQRFLTIKRNTALDSSEGMGWWFRFTSGNNVAASPTPPLTVLFNSYVAAGEDFSLFFFRGAPRLYFTTIA
jgi:hypothetical protein